MTPSSIGHERRSQPRLEKLSLVQVGRFDEDGARLDLTAGRTLDISSGGVRLELYHALPLRSTVRLTLALENTLIEVSGTVVHLEVLDHERCSVGLEFRDLSDEARHFIDESVRQAEPAP